MSNPHQNPVIKNISLKSRSQGEIDQIRTQLAEQLGDDVYDQIEHLDGVSKAHDVAELMKGVFLEGTPFGHHLSNAESRGLSLIFEQIQDLMSTGTDRKLIAGNDLYTLNKQNAAE